MATAPATQGKLVDNIVHFVRALRKAGVRVGSSQAQTAISAVTTTGFAQRVDFYYALRATLVTQAKDLDVFHQVFQMFWRDPKFLERMVRSMLPIMQTMAQDDGTPKPAQTRASEAMWGDAPGKKSEPKRDEIEVDAALSWSENEVLRKQDFERMTLKEQADAIQLIRGLRLPIDPLITRRFQQSRARGRPDMRAMLRRSLRRGGEVDRMSLKMPRTRPPDLVVICDISGSMTAYARMMMHFMHTLAWAPTADWARVYGFTFGTRLTNISRALSEKDVDRALDVIGQDAPDWQGGTRIGEALCRFNRDWSRRVLSQGAVVMLITDGLERGDTDILKTEAARLSRSCRRLIWLNPLLRFDEFAPKAAGIRSLLPIVDSFHTCHSVDSLADLGRAFQSSDQRQQNMQAMRQR